MNPAQAEPPRILSDWHVEKINHTMESLATLADELLRADSGKKLSVLGTMALAEAIRNTTKLYLNAHRKSGSGLEYQLIMEKGSEGFEEVRLTAGLRSGFTLDQAAREIESHLANGPASGRQRISDALRNCISRHAFVKEAGELEFRLRSGEVSWEAFVAAMREVLQAHSLPAGAVTSENPTVTEP